MKKGKKETDKGVLGGNNVYKGLLEGWKKTRKAGRCETSRKKEKMKK